ncbi:MAG: LPS export ABC transporter ATP-binding protein [Desulfonauticus sp.]|nr:LPS export ABC transporter ATP-binding protein [Desulfonauticus sp.]
MSKLKGLDLRKQYGKKEVVRGINLEVGQGEVVGLLGPNGAGKTTTFYMLVGIVLPTRGKVYLDEREITHLSLPRRAKLGISYLPQENSVFKKLTVEENLLIILEYTDLTKNEQRERAYNLMQELGIFKLAKQKAAYLSGGERRRLEIARSLILNPKFILLDEPFAGIDPIAIDDIQKIIVSLKNRNIGVLISDHNVRETLRICDRSYLVYDGRIFLEGTPQEIAANSKAKQIYLGSEFCL